MVAGINQRHVGHEKQLFDIFFYWYRAASYKVTEDCG